jgi:hypothetical protein
VRLRVPAEKCAGYTVHVLEQAGAGARRGRRLGIPGKQRQQDIRNRLEASQRGGGHELTIERQARRDETVDAPHFFRTQLAGFRFNSGDSMGDMMIPFYIAVQHRMTAM